MQFAAAERIGLVDMIIPRLCLNSVALPGIRTTPSKNCSPGSKKLPGLRHFIAYPSGFAPAILDTASIQGSFCHLLCLQNGGCSAPAPQAEKCSRSSLRGKFRRVACLPAHGDVSTKAGMRERARDGFGEETSGGGGKAERKIFSIMLARKVNRTETSLRNCAALSFICT